MQKTTVKINDKTYTGQTVNTDVLTWYGNLTVYVTVQDTRGRTTSKNFTVSVVNYYKPIIKSFKVERCNQAGTLDEQGAYFKASYSVDIAPVNNKNVKSAILRYRRQGTSTWTTQAITLSGYAVSGSIIKAANTEYTYEVEFEISDSFEVPVTAQTKVSTVFTLVDYHSSGTGIAVGKVAEKADALDVALDMFIKGVDHTVTESEYDEQMALIGGSTSGKKRLSTLFKTIVSYIKNMNSDTGWKLLTNSTENWGAADASSNYVVYRKVGRMVDIRSYLMAEISTSSISNWLIASGLPADCQPRNYSVRCRCAHHNGEAQTINIPYSSSESAGKIYFYGKIAKGYSMWFQITYVV